MAYSILPRGPKGDSAYVVAVSRGFVGTKSEWLASLHGIDATQVELRESSTHIQWRLIGGTWADLVPLVDITPEKGVDYVDGIDGNDGREIEIQKGTTYIQWRYVGEAGWTNIVSLA
jgi:hypothetical protein